MRKSWISLTSVIAGLVAIGAFTDACSSGGGGGGGTPTPTPLSATISNFYTQSGTSTVNPGECVGFKVTEANNQFTPATQMEIDLPDGTNVFQKPFGDINSTSQAFYHILDISSNGSSFTFGSTGNGLNYPCATLPFLPAGNYQIKVIQGAANQSIANALTWGNPQGPAAILGTAFTAAPVSGNLAHFNDFNYHQFTAGAGFSVVTMDSAGGTAFISDPNGYQPPYVPGGPYIAVEGVVDDPTAGPIPDGSALFADGWDVVVAPTVKGDPATGRGVVVVRSDIVDGTTGGFHYQLTLSSAQMTTIAGSDTCASGGAPDFRSVGGGKYWTVVNLTGKAGDYNPGGAQGCRDRHTLDQPNAGVNAPGPDNTYTVLLAPGERIRAAAQSEAADVVLYLVDQGTCGATITSCHAAADIFGPTETDSIRYTNTTGAPQLLNLIVDDFNATESGTFNLYVEIK